MKVLITGATGWVGSNVLNQALRRPEITEIILLQRRACPDSPFPNETNLNSTVQSGQPKITTILHPDFSSYPPTSLRTLLPQLHGTTTILWALGGRHDKFPDLETARAVNITYLEVFCAQVLPHLIPSNAHSDPNPPTFSTSTSWSSPSSGPPPLRFVLCSGAMPEPNPDARLWFLAETRKMKGAAEGVVFGAASAYEQNEEEEGGEKEGFEPYTVRPAVILPEKPGWGEWVHGKIAPSVGVRELAAVMVDVGVGGGGGERVWEVGAIRRRGRELLRDGGQRKSE